MNRRFAPVLPTVLLVALGISLNLAGSTAMALQVVDATPETSREDMPFEGFLGGVTRTFEASGFRFIGGLYLSFVVLEFDSNDHASSASASFIDLLRESGEFDDMQRASVRSIGDETVAYVGEVALEDDEDALVDSVQLAMLAVVDGRYLHLMFGIALAGDPLTELADIAESVVGREPGDRTPVVGTDGMRTGGIWDMVPAIDDLPEGFVFDQEEEIESFGEQGDSLFPLQDNSSPPQPTGPTPTACATPEGVTISAICESLTLGGNGTESTDEFFLLRTMTMFSLEFEGFGEIRVLLRDETTGLTRVLFEESGPFSGFMSTSIADAGEYSIVVEAVGPWSMTIRQR